MSKVTKSDEMEQYVLGIDIGTTSVKACIINTKNNNVESTYVKDTQSNIPSDTGPGGNKQDVSKIISAMNICVSKLPKHLLAKVKTIGICGQMHGVVFWNKNGESSAWNMIERDKNARFDIVKENVSALYTWQDNRCNPDFLSTLPVPKSHVGLSTGFGIPTLFWMIKNKPKKLMKFNCAGTIADFAVAMLCNLSKPVMSDQNAAGWGYFDCSTNQWNVDILKANGFFVEFLPDIKLAGSLAGELVENWHSIPCGTPISVAMGDIQCSVLSIIQGPSDAVLNISTSAQITFIEHKFVPHSGPPSKDPIDYNPYFNKTFIAVAASLNGGNCLATFVKMLQQWVLDLGHAVPQSKLWEKVLSLANEETAESDLVVKPTCLGERYDPNLKGSITNINVGNLHLGQVFNALCKGMVQNLHEMMPKNILQQAKITRILGNGSGLIRNAVLQKHIQQMYDIPLECNSQGDAARGAAMAMTNLLHTSMSNISAKAN